jgi:hypothetical protein
MSTGAKFRIYTDGVRWGYKLQCWPYGESPECETHGPFSSEEKLWEHKNSHSANPGGSMTDTVTPEELTEILSETTI